VAFDAMLLDIDDETGKARTIQRIRREEPEA
jgi:calcineurin-like phosphoesterase